MNKEEYEQIKENFEKSKAKEKHLNKSKKTNEKLVRKVIDVLEKHVRKCPYVGFIRVKNPAYCRALYNLKIQDILREKYPFLEIEVNFFHDYVMADEAQIYYEEKKHD